MIARPREKPKTTEELENEKKSKSTVSAKAIKYLFIYLFIILSEDLRMFLSIRNYGLLSFGNEAEEDEEELTKVSMVRIEIVRCISSLRVLIEFQKFRQHGTGKSAHDLANDATLSKTAVRLDEDDEQSDEELPIEKQTSKIQEKSDAQFDREQLDRVRQKLVKQDKKKPVVLDADDEDQQTNSKLQYINL